MTDIEKLRQGVIDAARQAIRARGTNDYVPRVDYLQRKVEALDAAGTNSQYGREACGPSPVCKKCRGTGKRWMKSTDAYAPAYSYPCDCKER